MKKGWLTLVCTVCLIFVFAAPSVAQVIKLTYADQAVEMAWGSVNATRPWQSEDRSIPFPNPGQGA